MQNLAYHESKCHGTVDFPVAFYYVDENHVRYNMPFHWHKEWEIIRIVQGKLSIQADEESYMACEGDVVLLRDGMLHGGVPENCIYECLVFDLHGLYRDVDWVKKYLRPIYHNHLLPQILYPNHQKDIYPIVEELMNAFPQKEFPLIGNAAPHTKANRFPFQTPELTVIGNISRLFAAILREGYYTEYTLASYDSPSKITRLKPVLEYIETHFSSPLTLDTLSHIAGMSPKYFCRFFHSLTHQTLMDYVNYYRIEQAARQLCTTDISVTDVGLECGFNDSSYFIKTFKKYKGITPMQFRKTCL